MDAWNSIDRLMVLSSDAHAGALPEHYSADDRLRPPASGQRGGSATKLAGS